MQLMLERLGYILDDDHQIWIRPDYMGISYSDGDEVENRIFEILKNANDLSVLSDELRSYCTDWPSLYHLSSSRANILRPFESDLSLDVLEIGAGCGAITRYLGECGGSILALEGSPRRAAIARARTRDLANVTVLSEKFENFKIDKKFDVITLIGVLEYANLFTSSEAPAQTMLEMVGRFLKPDGKLIIAIENQLGLKYFAGAPEDHIGQPMYGIEGRYDKKQPQTYGKSVLKQMINSVGFKGVEFLAPFPDYKFPVSIVSEAGFEDDDFDTAVFAIQSVRKDTQLPNLLAFSPELVWRSLDENKLSLDMSNSFLIMASNRETGVIDKKNYAWHFNTSRLQRYTKLTRFVKNKKMSIDVFAEPFCYSSASIIDNDFLTQDLPKKYYYHKGRVLSEEFIKTISKEGWSGNELKTFLLKYLDALQNIMGTSFPENELTKVSGKYMDCMPQNIIEKEDGVFEFFDREWNLRVEVDIGFLIFRAINIATSQIFRFGTPLEVFENTNLGFIKFAIKKLGWDVSDDKLSEYIALEYKIQRQVSYLDIGFDQYVSGFNSQMNFGQSLNCALQKRDHHIECLNQALQERDLKINKIYNSRYWKIKNFFRISGKKF